MTVVFTVGVFVILGLLPSFTVALIVLLMIVDWLRFGLEIVVLARVEFVLDLTLELLLLVITEVF